MRPLVQRGMAALSGLWLGLLLTVALVAAPSAFAVLERPQAGLMVARLFAIEAPASLALALLLVVLQRWRPRGEEAPAASWALWWPLLALGATVWGYYVLQPLMAEARAGQGAFSFAQLHGLSLGLYGVKTLVVAGLWARLHFAGVR